MEDAVTLANLHKPDVAVLDFRLSEGGRGSDIVALINDKTNMGILDVSADHLNDLLTTNDGDAYIQKPYSINDLLASVDIVSSIKGGRFPGGRLPELTNLPKNFHYLKSSIALPQKIA